MAGIIADALTAFRLCLALYLVWVGFSSSDKISALTLIVYALLLGWTADILDGWFARKSNSPTRLGHFDFPLDMVMVAGSLLGVTALGYIPAKATLGAFSAGA
jgi:phosphatidylglycerophosphate synthase